MAYHLPMAYGGPNSNFPAGSRSTTPYSFREQDVDDIIRTTTFHRADDCRAALWFSPEEQRDILQSMAAPSTQPTDERADSLQDMPPQLQRSVLLSLDIRTIFKKHELDPAFRKTIRAFEPFRRAVFYGMTAVCALLRTGISTNVTLSQFDKVLCDPCCYICGKFGGFVFLPTWARCCVVCLPHACQYPPWSARSRRFYLTEKDVDDLEKNCDQAVNMCRKVYAQRETEVCLGTAYLWRTRQLPMPRQVNNAVKAFMDRGEREQQALRFWNMNYEVLRAFEMRAQIRFPHPRTLIPNNTNMEQAVCVLPYYNKLTNRVDAGLECAGCQLNTEIKTIHIDMTQNPAYKPTRDCPSRAKAWEQTAYTRDNFLKHFRWCLGAQRLWERRDEDKELLSHLPMVPAECNFKHSQSEDIKGNRLECGCSLPWGTSTNDEACNFSHYSTRCLAGPSRGKV